MNSEFSSLRGKFGLAFYKVRLAINEKRINPEEIKMLLSDCFPFHKTYFGNKNLKTVHEVLEVVKEKCTLIDINCLEVVIKQFDVKEAFPHIETYKKQVEEFCKQFLTSLSCSQSLQVMRTPQTLSSETLVFVLDWEPRNCTMNDIRDLIRKASEPHRTYIRIDQIEPNRSISVTCYVPMCLMGGVVANTLLNIQYLSSKGLKELIVSCITIWKVATTVNSEVSNSYITDMSLHFIFYRGKSYL